jgi:6,7-dimethyl-8-ribityllumazine synthase
MMTFEYGRYMCNNEVVAAWVRSLVQTKVETKLPLIRGMITPEEFSKAFKVISEYSHPRLLQGCITLSGST